MSYLHIANLYKDQRILMFRECYALEKIHGTSAHITWRAGAVGDELFLTFFSGGEKYERFVALFDELALRTAFAAMGHPAITVYGEAYGGSQQKQAWRYGALLRFVAFDVQIGETWLSVPSAHDVVSKLGLEFVHYERVPTLLVALDMERDAPSEQARRNGVGGDQPREGVVLRPLEEFSHAYGRIIAKHKRDEERETNTPRKVVDPSKMDVLRAANEIADEWVTPTRLAHVLDKLLGVGTGEVGIERTRDVITAMTEDILREGAGEIVDSREARGAIGKKTAEMFKAHLKEALR